MFWLLVAILLLLWIRGFFTFNLGSAAHVLLVILVVAFVYYAVTGRRPPA